MCRPEIRAKLPSKMADPFLELIDISKSYPGVAALKNVTVAVAKGEVIGLVGVHRTVTVHRPAPVGRITILVVAEAAQDHGIGRILVEAAEQWCRKAGCRIIEVTSNDRRSAAHAFYRHLGYERTSLRFMKEL